MSEMNCPQEKEINEVLDEKRKNDRLVRPFVYTVCLMVAFFGLGLLRAQEGVAFLDLLIIVGEDIERGTILVVLSALGNMMGALIAGVIYDRVNIDVTYFVSVFGAGLLCFAIPFCDSLPLMGCAMLVRSMFAGSINSGGTFICMKIWGKQANSYVQALHCLFAVGALVGPLLTEPFLAPKHMRTDNSNQTTNTSTCLVQTGDVTLSSGNTTHNYHIHLNGTSIQGHETSKVYISFIIIGVFILVASVPFFTIAIRYQGKSLLAKPRSNNAASKSGSGNIVTTSKSRCLGFYLLVAAICTCYLCVERGCALYLMPFSVEYLRWSKSSGARLTSVFWGTFASWRFAGILLARMISAFKMLLFDFIFLIIGFVILLFVTDNSPILLWVGVAVVGSAQASIFATSTTWINRNVTPLTGVLSAYILVSGTVGCMIYLPLIGYFFENISPMWFIYLSLGCAILCFFSFMILFFLYRNNQDIEHS